MRPRDRSPWTAGLRGPPPSINRWTPSAAELHGEQWHDTQRLISIMTTSGNASFHVSSCLSHYMLSCFEHQCLSYGDSAQWSYAMATAV